MLIGVCEFRADNDRVPTKEFPGPTGSLPVPTKDIPSNPDVSDKNTIPADHDSGTSMKQDWISVGSTSHGAVYITPANNIIVTDESGHTTAILPMDD